ncbi:hypothetical protein [Pseudomonas sp. 31-12]|uniref:hypothetical protein n=1 Tax=Pseudomonas sp. 31-12 TaxID=2201356 RepID=UPI0015A98813|nr:hypothetical protein [Pseudomonas sp. 31-12]
MGVQAAVAGGLGITALGTSFLQEGMRILEPSEKLPALPCTEVAVIGDDVRTQHLVQPLMSLLTEGVDVGEPSDLSRVLQAITRATRPGYGPFDV